MAVRNNLLYFVQMNGGDTVTDSKPLQPDKSYVVYEADMLQDRIHLTVNAKVDCVIDWGDDTAPTVNTGGGLVYHNYSTAGRFLITVSGKFYGFEAIWGSVFVNDEIVSAYLGTNCYALGRFASCQKLETIVIDSPYITTIGERAFDGCNKLSAVRFLFNDNEGYGGYITTIGKKAFSGCFCLINFVVPVAVTTIGERSFAHCLMLENIQLNSGLEQIGKEAFFSCRSLKEIVLPNWITYIGERAFYGCLALRTIEFMANDVALLTSALPQDSIFEECKIARIVATSMENARDIEDMITAHGGGFATVLEPNSECSGINELLDEINGEVV